VSIFKPHKQYFVVKMIGLWSNRWPEKQGFLPCGFWGNIGKRQIKSPVSFPGKVLLLAIFPYGN